MLHCKSAMKSAAVCAILSLAMCLGVYAQPGTITREPLATVNGTAISGSDLEREAAFLTAEMNRRNYPLGAGQLADLHDQLIRNLIDRELLYQQATAREIKISPHWVDREWNDMQMHLGGKAALQAFMQNSGFSRDQMNERIRKGLIVQRLLKRDVFRSIRVSEAEMQAFYNRHSNFFNREEQVRARHVMIAVPDWDNQAAREQALDRIRALEIKIRQGMQLGALALEYSDCPSKTRGGDLGYFSRNQMIQSFSDAAFELQPGEISQVVETRFGYHLIEVVDRQPPSRMVYKNVRDKIELTLRRNKEKAAAEAYLNRLKQKARIATAN
jgi:peptidyl-prolyl cis-trans isomerase C